MRGRQPRQRKQQQKNSQARKKREEAEDDMFKVAPKANPKNQLFCEKCGSPLGLSCGSGHKISTNVTSQTTLRNAYDLLLTLKDESDRIRREISLAKTALEIRSLDFSPDPSSLGSNSFGISDDLWKSIFSISASISSKTPTESPPPPPTLSNATLELPSSGSANNNSKKIFLKNSVEYQTCISQLERQLAEMEERVQCSVCFENFRSTVVCFFFSFFFVFFFIIFFSLIY